MNGTAQHGTAPHQTARRTRARHSNTGNSAAQDIAPNSTRQARKPRAALHHTLQNQTRRDTGQSTTPKATAEGGGGGATERHTTHKAARRRAEQRTQGHNATRSAQHNTAQHDSPLGTHPTKGSGRGGGGASATAKHNTNSTTQGSSGMLTKDYILIHIVGKATLGQGVYIQN